MDKKIKIRPGRVQVKCVKCGSEFNRDYKKTHEQKVHNGETYQVKNVGAPDNPFAAAKKTKTLSTFSEGTSSTQSQKTGKE